MSKSISKLNVQVTGDARPLDKTIAGTKKKLDTLAPTTNGLAAYAEESRKALAALEHQAATTQAKIKALKDKLGTGTNTRGPSIFGSLSSELAENALGGITGGKIAKMLGGVGLAVGGPLALLAGISSFGDSREQLKSREDFADMSSYESFVRSIPLLGSVLGDFADWASGMKENARELEAFRQREKQWQQAKEQSAERIAAYEKDIAKLAEQRAREQAESNRKVAEMSVGGIAGRELAVRNERIERLQGASDNRRSAIETMLSPDEIEKQKKEYADKAKALQDEAIKLRKEADEIRARNNILPNRPNIQAEADAKLSAARERESQAAGLNDFANKEDKIRDKVLMAIRKKYEAEVDAIYRETNKKLNLMFGIDPDTKGIMDAFENIQNSIDGLSIDNFDAMIKEFKKLNPLEKDLDAFKKKVDELRKATEAMDAAKEAEANRKNSYKQALEDFKRFQLESARIDKQIQIEKERNSLKRIEAEIRADGEAQKAKLRQAGVVGKEYDEAAKKIDEATEKTVKQQVALERQRKANSIKDSNMTPTEQLQQQLDEIGDLLTNGFLSEADARKAVENATNGLIQAQASPNQDIMLAGSGEAQKAAFIASGQVLDGSNPMLAQQKKTNEILNDIRDNGKLDNAALISF